MGKLVRRQSGEHYEAWRAVFAAPGFALLDRKELLTKVGEIDLIFQQGETIVFVEVKYRKNDSFGSAAEMVNRAKMRKLVKTANVWLMKQGKSVHTISIIGLTLSPFTTMVETLMDKKRNL